tara:strand:+ start:4569 stop:4832 length:264 start_codon:yes stop_codon:yes gene_type:complete
MKNLNRTTQKNHELNEWFLTRINIEIQKPEKNQSLAFMNGYDLRSEVLEKELSETKENKLLSFLKNKIIVDLKAEKLNSDFELLLNK